MLMSDITIEIGHTYAPDKLLPKSHGFISLKYPIPAAYNPDYLSAAVEHSERLHKIASFFGKGALRVAMLDDVALQDKLNGMPLSDQKLKWQYTLRKSTEALQRGTNADELYHESEFEAAGRDIVLQIKNMDLPAGQRLSQDQRKLKVGSGKDTLVIPLQGFSGVDDPTFPSCQVLDIAWLQKRLTLAPEAITVLPTGYEDQQRGVAVLAGLVGIDEKSYQTVFYDPVVAA